MKNVYRDGVALYYDEDGGGDPPMLFVHGWCCDHTYFAPQFEHFRKEHRCVAVDQRGHGRSDKPEQTYSMSAFAEDLAWVCNEIGVQKPVVVGHSMGGVIATQLAAQFPDLPSAIVLVDAPVAAPRGLREGLAPLFQALRSPGYRETAQGFVADRLFIDADDRERKQRIVDAMASAPQHVMASAFEQIFAWDDDEALPKVTCPVLNIQAAGPLNELPRFQQLCPQLINGQTVGAGHFNQLEVPDQVNAMIERFLAIALPKKVLT
jgi:pimeloyl-ACP methyl ester carboxylesterase